MFDDYPRAYDSKEEDRIHNSQNPYYRDAGKYYVMAPVRDNRKALTWILKRVYTPTEYREFVFYNAERQSYEIEATYVEILKINALEKLFKERRGFEWISDGYYDRHRYEHTDEEWKWAQEWAMKTVTAAENGRSPAPRVRRH